MSDMSVSLFVRPSVKRVNCDKAKEISARILITHKEIDAPSFATLKIVHGNAPLYLKFWTRVTPSKTAIFILHCVSIKSSPF